MSGQTGMSPYGPTCGHEDPPGHAVLIVKGRGQVLGAKGLGSGRKASRVDPCPGSWVGGRGGTGAEKDTDRDGMGRWCSLAQACSLGENLRGGPVKGLLQTPGRPGPRVVGGSSRASQRPSGWGVEGEGELGAGSWERPKSCVVPRIVGSSEKKLFFLHEQNLHF